MKHKMWTNSGVY